MERKRLKLTLTYKGLTAFQGPFALEEWVVKAKCISDRVLRGHLSNEDGIIKIPSEAEAKIGTEIKTGLELGLVLLLVSSFP